MSKWREIRCDFFNEEEERYYVDAWKTGNDNEEGNVIAKIDLANGTVEYLDEDARTDEDAQVVINEFLDEYSGCSEPTFQLRVSRYSGWH